MGKVGNTPEERIQKNEKYKGYLKIVRDTIESDDRKLVDSRAFMTERYTDSVVFFFEFAHNVGPSSFETTRHWYRAMPTHEYKHLKTHNKLDCQYYGGIASHYSYSKDNYLTNNGPNTHLVEFSVGMDGAKFVDLIHKETKKKQGRKWAFHEIKPEDGAVSIGLGKTGHYKGEAGTVFNEMLSKHQITWRLCCFRHKLDNNAKDKVKKWKEDNNITGNDNLTYGD